MPRCTPKRARSSQARSDLSPHWISPGARLNTISFARAGPKRWRKALCNHHLGRTETVSTPLDTRPICHLRVRSYLSALRRRHDKGNPGASLVRKATGPSRAAELPKVTSRSTSSPSSEERRGTLTGFRLGWKDCWSEGTFRSSPALRPGSGHGRARAGLLPPRRARVFREPSEDPHATLPRQPGFEALRVPQHAPAPRSAWAPIRSRREHGPSAPLRWRRVRPAPIPPEESSPCGGSGNHEGARALSPPRRRRARVGPRAVGERRATQKEDGRSCRHGDGVHGVH